MGRHQTDPNDESNGATVDSDTANAIEERLGLRQVVCVSCKTKNPNAREPCRSCGGTKFRPKAREYRGKGSNNSGDR